MDSRGHGGTLLLARSWHVISEAGSVGPAKGAASQSRWRPDPMRPAAHRRAQAATATVSAPSLRKRSRPRWPRRARCSAANTPTRSPRSWPTLRLTERGNVTVAAVRIAPPRAVTRMARRASFGSVRKLPSGRWQARYTAPGGSTVAAPSTFDTKLDAQAWLATVRADLVRGAWLPADRGNHVRHLRDAPGSSTARSSRAPAPTTASLLDAHLLPTFAATPIRRLSPALVREWHAKTALSYADRAGARVHAAQDDLRDRRS